MTPAENRSAVSCHDRQSPAARCGRRAAMHRRGRARHRRPRPDPAHETTRDGPGGGRNGPWMRHTAAVDHIHRRRPGHRVRTSASMLLTSQPRNHVPASQVKGNVDAVPGADAGQHKRVGEPGDWQWRLLCPGQDTVSRRICVSVRAGLNACWYRAARSWAAGGRARAARVRAGLTVARLPHAGTRSRSPVPAQPTASARRFAGRIPGLCGRRG